MNSVFDRALGVVLKHEGLYSNVPQDRGGETVKGISRVKHPSWKGWNLVDAMKTKPNFPQCLASEKHLTDQVSYFYRLQFWDNIKGDELAKLDFEIALEVFDTAVNMGIYWASVFLQQSLNLFNRGYRETPLYPNLVEDGIIGKKTLAALAVYLDNYPPHKLLTFLNAFQGYRYAEIMKASEAQEIFASGWAERVQINKSYV